MGECPTHTDCNCTILQSGILIVSLREYISSSLVPTHTWPTHLACHHHCSLRQDAGTLSHLISFWGAGLNMLAKCSVHLLLKHNVLVFSLHPILNLSFEIMPLSCVFLYMVVLVWDCSLQNLQRYFFHVTYFAKVFQMSPLCSTEYIWPQNCLRLLPLQSSASKALAKVATKCIKLSLQSRSCAATL